MKTLLNLPQIAEYKALKLIYEGDRTLVYRGRNIECGQPVAIKLMRNEYPSFNELIQFRNQYAISKNLEIEGIVKPYALERYENRYTLIMEDVAGISLADYKGRNTLPLSQFFNIALQLTDILHDLHQNQVIHKDIKPANILIHPETQQIKLIDFSISTLLPKETQTIKTPNVLEGTLAYLAPEQTGRMNRGIDYRSDFYALGVTLYELLAGRLPFNNDDPMELIHAHIAQQPIPLCDWLNGNGENYSQSLSDIILKLMAKNAEDRYQSALGLKYDLENCRSQWQETGTIAPFVLGERDMCDRFLIPEKLYGREKEVKTLLAAFERVSGASGALGDSHSQMPPSSLAPSAELFLVAGFSGIGKTAVVNEVHKPIVRQRGYFIKGKFDQFNRNIPFSAFVQAFRDLMEQLLGESDAQLQQWKTKILEAVGENGQVLIEVIPELEQIIGEQPPILELSGSAAQNRFNLLLQKFIFVFTTKEHPLVIFLDDLQWADSASLNLLKVLMGDSQTEYLLLLGAYRDNEVFLAHPLMLCLGELKKKNTTISTITLAPLSVAHINQLVAETLSCSEALAAPLTDLVYQKTKGNPFFTTQFLKGLQVDRLIAFNRNWGYWECDLVKVRDAALTDDVVEFMAGRLHKLPDETQNLLKLAACIGNQFDLETLATICESPLEEVATDLWSALREGLILPQSEAYKFFQGEEREKEKVEGVAVGYRFLHDRVQQAAYSLIPDEQKPIAHYQIGKLLLHSLSPERWGDNIFDIVNHFNKGKALIKTRAERHQLSELNLMAGKKALAATAYVSATQYCDRGIQFLEVDCWQSQYQLALSLYQSAIEAEYLNINFTRARALANLVLEKVTNVLDRVKTYELKIQMHMAEAEMPKSLTIGQSALELLGVDLNDAPDASEIELPELSAIASKPIMQAPEQIAAMRILIAIIGPTYITQPELLPPILLTAINRGLKHGHISITAQAYVWYGLFLCGSRQDLEKGYSCGLLALKVLEHFPAQELECCVNNLFNVFIRPWKEPWMNSIKPLEKAREIGFDTGDIEYASYATAHRCTYLFLSGANLKEVQEQQNLALEILNRVKQEHSLGHARIWGQLVSNLRQDVADPKKLSGDYFDETELLPSFCAGGDRSLPFTVYLAKCILNYLFADYSAAVAAAVKAETDAEVALGITAVIYNFYYSLSLLCDCRDGSTSKSDRQSLLKQVEINQKAMKEWVVLAPQNCEHKYDLVEAEKCRVLGRQLEAIDLYNQAIAGAKANQYLQEEALANELAAKFYLDWGLDCPRQNGFNSAQPNGKEMYATLHMQEAYYGYARWGAKAKIADLENRYPHLLASILQQHHNSLATATLATMTRGTVSKTTTGTGDILDLATLMKASRTLSENIELEGAIANLMQIARENAGAQTITLMLFEADVLMLVAKVEGEERSIVNPLPADISNAVPLRIINRVKRSRQPVISDNASREAAWGGDTYIHHQQPKSILCLPLVVRAPSPSENHGKLIGILYLENNQVSGAFTSDRVEILSLLCSQAAITLQNAQLYDKEQQVRHDLQQALTDLQQAQLQLVQGEKMATLGNLVAGVAHEINNPLGFIGGNIAVIQDYLQDLYTIIEGYREELPQPSPQLAENIEELDLDFLLEDFPKTIASMQEGCDRIFNISTSLRTFSRTDADRKTEFNLHEGIDSTLLILKYRLKANEQRPAIEIVKKYGDIPEIQCYPGQLNQVFMNLLANAIDALDESNVGKTYEEIEKAPNRITISTELSRDLEQVIIRIKDNGKGMTETVQARIFEQGFTTKGVGKGTGLGMAIALQIIEEKHGGAIACQSELGQGTEFIISLPIS